VGTRALNPETDDDKKVPATIKEDASYQEFIFQDDKTHDTDGVAQFCRDGEQNVE
jgi:hypothetical protein